VHALASLLSTKSAAVLERAVAVLALMAAEPHARRAVFESGAVSALFSIAPRFPGGRGGGRQKIGGGEDRVGEGEQERACKGRS
jgi:hypothetical protein